MEIFISNFTSENNLESGGLAEGGGRKCIASHGTFRLTNGTNGTIQYLLQRGEFRFPKNVSFI